MHPRAHIGFERRRQIQIRKSFTGGLELASQADRDLTEFLTLCGEYMVMSLVRLDEQDQKISDLLKDRVPKEDKDLHERLRVLDERQEKCRSMTNRFAEAVKRLKEKGREGVSAFLKDARDFIAEFTGLLAPRKNPLEAYTEKHFTEEDWEYIADRNEAAVAMEEELYVRIQALAPEGLDPAGFTAEHKPD